MTYVDAQRVRVFRPLDFKTSWNHFITISNHQTLEAMLNRGEKLDDLVAKSEDLSGQSKAFYMTARKANSCSCVIL